MGSGESLPKYFSVLSLYSPSSPSSSLSFFLICVCLSLPPPLSSHFFGLGFPCPPPRFHLLASSSSPPLPLVTSSSLLLLLSVRPLSFSYSLLPAEGAAERPG